jgi:hypothetical protein
MLIANAIVISRHLFVTGDFKHPDGMLRPSGAYATNIPPWANMTQLELRKKLYAFPKSHRVPAFVAF